MAPELLRGNTCTRESDVYAFGILLYEAFRWEQELSSLSIVRVLLFQMFEYSSFSRLHIRILILSRVCLPVNGGYFSACDKIVRSH